MNPVADPAAWLAAHTLRCERYRAQISPEACERQQAWRPDGCVKCRQRGTDQVPAVLPGRAWRQYPAKTNTVRRTPSEHDAPQPKEAPMGKSKPRPCAECGRSRVICGRGLCSTCYHRAQKAGVLDRHPTIGTFGGARTRGETDVRTTSPSPAAPVPSPGPGPGAGDDPDRCGADQPPAPSVPAGEAPVAPAASKGGAAASLTDTAAEIRAVCGDLAEWLVEKNRAYGDSALDPVRVFSRADPVEQLRVRIDDKLSRLMRGHEIDGDDTLRDLTGYLVLLEVATRRPAGGR